MSRQLLLTTSKATAQKRQLLHHVKEGHGSDKRSNIVLAYDICADEVEHGTHQLETLYENAIDRNFDAFELYALRNIFNIPEELTGWMRLSHHKVRALSSIRGFLTINRPLICRPLVSKLITVFAMFGAKFRLPTNMPSFSDASIKLIPITFEHSDPMWKS